MSLGNEHTYTHTIQRTTGSQMFDMTLLLQDPVCVCSVFDACATPYPPTVSRRVAMFRFYFQNN